MNLGGFRCWVRYPFVYGLCLITKEAKQGVTITLFITGWVWFITFTFSYLQVCNYYCVQLSWYFSIYLFFLYLFKPRCLFFFFLLLSVCLSHSTLCLTEPLSLPLFLLALSSFPFTFFLLSIPLPPLSQSFTYCKRLQVKQLTSPGRLAFVRCFSKRRKEKKKNISLLYNIPLCEA